MNLTILVGNPGAASRTLALAQAVGAQVAAILSECASAPAVTTIDLAEHAGGIFDPANETISGLNRLVARSDFLVVATPTYKASYTGLLKAFLDRYDTNALARVVAIPVMTGGSPAHSLAPDVTLRPLLVELGASVPTRSLYFMTSQMPQLAEVVAAWAAANHSAIAGAARAPRPASSSAN